MERKSNVSQAITAEKSPSILLDCPNCHSFIAADNVNEERQIAKCSHCEHIFSYKNDGYWDPFGLPTETRPKGLEILRLPSFLEISQEMKGDRLNMGLVLLFTAFWNGALIFMITQFAIIGRLEFIPFTLIHLLLGMFLILSSLSMLFNRTIFHLDENHLSVETKPISIFTRKKLIPKNTIQQLSVKECRDGSTVSYDLQLLTTDDRKITLLSFMDKNTLHHIEGEIERYFHIMNYPVRD